jgi:hypothetical protein
MRLSTILFISAILFVNLAPGAQSYPTHLLTTYPEGFVSDEGLARFTLPSDPSYISPCQVEDSKPGCSRRDLRVSTAAQSPVSPLLLAQVNSDPSQAEPTCRMLKTYYHVGRGSGRCEP